MAVSVHKILFVQMRMNPIELDGLQVFPSEPN